MNRYKYTSRHVGNGHHSLVLKLHERVDHKTVFIHGLCIIQEFDDYANHRLSVNGRFSEWESYRMIAKVKFKEGWVAGTTDYYQEVLPRVFIYTGVGE